MFDFRYHALSLVAVFLALTVGLLLGVAIGDEGLVSSAERNVRGDLRSDVRRAQVEAGELRTALGRRDRYERAAYAPLVDGRLADRRVAILALGALGGGTVGSVRDALGPAGGTLAGVGVVRAPLDIAALAERLGATRGPLTAGDPESLERLGRRVGRGLAGSATLLGRLSTALLGSSTGAFDRLDGLVLVRAEPSLEGEEARAFDAFVDGLLAGLARAEVKVVGVETTRADPSQVPWFRDRGVASVDNVDQVAGRAALVFALGSPAAATGAWGIRPGADGILPPID